jgi:hyperosmotically inducible protein
MLFCGAAFLSYGQATDANSAKPDNTATNKRDRNASQVTADQQKMDATDRKLTKDIRHAVIHDKALSTYAHNVKIISRNGNVTLKGPVKSEEERKAVLEKAVAVAGGPDKVTDEMSVAQ